MNSNDAARVNALKTTEMCTLMVNMANFMLCLITRKKIGSRDIAQSMKFLLCMYEYLNSDSQHLGKKLSMVANAYNSSTQR